MSIHPNGRMQITGQSGPEVITRREHGASIVYDTRQARTGHSVIHEWMHEGCLESVIR